ncbi:MAG TPA: PucR family transcriptional regulator ligand-binding domain-containing protein [Nocardioidaceae bacterium]|nr:PucR family transcriptional regulator ligand-binding domain-containing protein [Nocardioidaceae bacterium]
MITTPYGVTVRELLNLQSMEGAEVLAGERGLGRSVHGVNVMEVPDVVDWVKPRELLVTTGFPLVSGPDGHHDDGDASDRMVELVRSLHARGLAGMAIKLGRYVDAVHPEVLALADELDFPVLGLPMSLAFDDLLQETYARLNDVAAGVLQRIDALHNALSLLVLEGGDLQQIAGEVSRVLDVAVLVTSTDGRELAAALSEKQRERLAAADLFDVSGRFRVERASRRPAPVGDGEVLLLPVAAGGSDLARLVCFSPDHPVPPDDVSALERAATVAALLLTRQQAVAAVENKYRGDFLRDVFLGRAGDEVFVVEHAATFGWDIDRPMYVITAELDPPAPNEEPVSGRVRRMWQERFAAAWRQVCESKDPVIPTVDFTAEVVALVPVPGGAAEPARAEAATREVVDRLVASVRGDRGGGRRSFSVGVSRLVQHLSELPDAYSRARRAAEVGRRIRGGSSTTWFDELGLHRLIALVPDPAEVQEFATDVLGPLAGPTEEAKDLRNTLQILLDTNLNVAEAARKQFFHYNTMRYRVSKLERMLGPFTTDPHLRLDIAVALQALQSR